MPKATISRAFVLDDDPERIAALAVMFYRAGVAAHWAHSIQRIDAYRPPYDLVLLDHDLGDERGGCGNGYLFLRKLIDWGKLGWGSAEWRPSDPLVILHSWNPAGASAMKAIYPQGIVAEYAGFTFKHLLNSLRLPVFE